MTKIVLDARMINHSGIGTYSRNLINAIKKFPLSLLGDEKLLKHYSDEEAIKIIPAKSDIYSIKEQLELPVKIPRCDVFISPHYNIPIAPIKAKKRIVIIHDVYHLEFYDTLSLQQKLYAKFVINSAVNLSDVIVTVSEFSKSEILKHTNARERKIKIINFGINPEKFLQKINDEKLADVKQKFNLPEKFFLFVGNIKPHKNLFRLLEAFKLFLEKNNDYKLVIVGSKEGLRTADNSLNELLNNNEKLRSGVLFTGYVDNDELPLLYKLSYALVFPSLYEGFGIPPIEAMICGCPVISSNAASLPEACGDAALYIDPQNKNDISGKMLSIASDKELRESYIKKGYENVKRFSLERFTESWNNIIENLI